jgi:hypothetical protein
LVHMRSFLAITGQKTDLWLVRTVALLIGAVSATLLAAGWRNTISLEVLILGVGSALALGTIDVVYVTKRVISPIYLADAAAELALIVAWVFASMR